MTPNDDRYIEISNQGDLDYLIKRIKNGPLFARDFKFLDRNYLLLLFGCIGIDYDEFCKKYYYYDKKRNLHVSESGETNLVWISTYGIVAKDKATNNKAVNAFINQYTVISLLIDKAIEISNKEEIYDVDSRISEYLTELSPALFNNLIFYVEVFCKAYLLLNNVSPMHTHKIKDLHAKTKDIMLGKKHNDTLFHVLIMDELQKIISYVSSIPNFKEQFVKYDDNSEDFTIIMFQPESLQDIKRMIDLCHDFIIDYFYTGDETHYLNSGLLQRLLDKAENDDDKKRIISMYGHLSPSET